MSALTDAVAAVVAEHLGLTYRQIIAVNITAETTIVEYGRHATTHIEHRMHVIDNETGTARTDVELRRLEA